MIGYHLDLRSGKDSFLSKCHLSRGLKGEEEHGWFEGLWGGWCDWTQEKGWGWRSGLVVFKCFKLHVRISGEFYIKTQITCLCL